MGGLPANPYRLEQGKQGEIAMTLSMSPPTNAVKGVLVDPPLGVVKLDLTGEQIEIRFANARVESFPTSTVSLIGRNGHSVALNWAGTPIVIRCTEPSDVERVVERLEGSIPDPAIAEARIRSIRLGYAVPIVE